MPVSTQAVKLSGLTHKILCICDMSKETIIRVSVAGQSRAPVTLVPPPNGIKTTSCSQAGDGGKNEKIMKCKFQLSDQQTVQQQLHPFSTPNRTISTTSSWQDGQRTASGMRSKVPSLRVNTSKRVWPWARKTRSSSARDKVAFDKLEKRKKEAYDNRENFYPL